MANLKWNDERVKRQVAQRLERGMGKAMQLAVRECKQLINRGQPTRRSGTTGRRVGLEPSKPGEPPKKVTAYLQNSVRSKVVTSALAVKGILGNSAEYARRLELGMKSDGSDARPFLRRTILDNKRKLFRLIIKG